MTTKIKIAPLALALALGLALLVSAPPSAQPSPRDRGLGPLVGEWRMTSLEVGTEGNLQRVPYSGQIIFTKSGTMSVQAMNPDANAPTRRTRATGTKRSTGRSASTKPPGRSP